MTAKTIIPFVDLTRGYADIKDCGNNCGETGFGYAVLKH
jgi:hypothetical protein